MLELIISVVPLILLCTSVGLVLLNFDEVINYLGYLAKQLITSAPSTKTHAVDLQNQNTAEESLPTKSTSIFQAIPLRIATLFRAIFLPDFTIESPIHRTSAKTTEEPNILNEVAAQEASSIDVKTYSQNTNTPTTPKTEVHIHHQLTEPTIHHVFHIIKNIFFYLLLMVPFIIIGLVIMFYITDSKESGLSLNLWLSKKIEELMNQINTR